MEDGVKSADRKAGCGRFVVALIAWILIGVSLLFSRDILLDFGSANAEATLSVQTLNGGADVKTSELARRYRILAGDVLLGLAVTAFIFAGWFGVWRWIQNKGGAEVKGSGLSALVLLGVLVLTSGCMRPFDKPELVEVAANETAFLIPLDSNTDAQDCFKSVEFLRKKQVAEKRIQIPHRWISEGRTVSNGRYVESVRLLKVNRTPVTRTWNSVEYNKPDPKTELSAESKDSLGVTAGFTLTALIEPDDAAVFLFKYKSGTLETVVDTQIKNSIQSVFASECSKWALVELPLHKQDITDAIRKQVIPFYKEWGITIAADMGFVGGMTYDPKVQAAFDNVFTAQKAKERAEAEKASQVAVNEKELGIANNEANMKRIRADAEAYEIQKKADAIKAAGEIYVQMEMTKAFNTMAAKWNGTPPQILGGGMGMMNMVPINVDHSKEK